MDYWGKGHSLVTEELVTQVKGHEFKNPTKSHAQQHILVIPALRRWRREDPKGSLAGQPSQTGELQIHWGIQFQNIRWKAMEEEWSMLTSSLQVHCVHIYKHIHLYSTHTAKGGLLRSLYAIIWIQYSHIVIAGSWTHLYYWALGLGRKNCGYKLKWTLPYNQITYLPVDNEKSESERKGGRKGGKENTVVLESLQRKAVLNPPFSFPNHGHVPRH